MGDLYLLGFIYFFVEESAVDLAAGCDFFEESNELFLEPLKNRSYFPRGHARLITFEKGVIRVILEAPDFGFLAAEADDFV